MKKLLSVLLAVVLCFTTGVLAACTPTETESDKRLDFKTSNWMGNEEAGEMTYSVTKAIKAEDPLVISYQKNGAWQYVRTVIGFEEADLKQMKTLVLKGTMTTDTNDPIITLKFEGQEGFTNPEIHFYMSGTEKTYEWDVSSFGLDKATRLIIFAEGNRATANGTITLSDLYLTENAVNPANAIVSAKKAPNPTDADINVISATAAGINNNWFDSNDGVYTITKNGTQFNVSYAKKSNEYGSMVAYVKGDWSSYNVVKLTVKGTEGDEIIFKPFDRKEVRTTLTGGEDVITVSIADIELSDADKSGTMPMIIMIQPGQMDKTGTFTVIKAEFATEEIEVPVVEENNNITMNNLKITNWYDSGDKVYTIEKQEGGAVKVTYANVGEWSSIKAPLAGSILSEVTGITLKVKGEANKKILFKPFDSNDLQKEESLTGNEQEITVNITGNFNVANPVFIFIEPGVAGGSGEFTILGCEFTYTKKVAVVSNSSLDITESQWWYENDPNTYTSTKATTGVEVNCLKTNAWAFAALFFKLDGMAVSELKTLKVTITGPVGLDVIFKPFDNGALEKRANIPAGGELTFEIDLSAVVATLGAADEYKIILMVSPEAEAADAKITFSHLEFTK